MLSIVQRSQLICVWKCKPAISRLNQQTLRPHTSNSKAHVIFSGIQPTGVPHLGNYLGALQQWVQLQKKASPSTHLLYSIVDLHAITSSQDAEQLRRWKRETLATLLAIGLDPERSTIFYQSAVWSMGWNGYSPEHLCWELAGPRTHRVDVDTELYSLCGIPFPNDTVEGLLQAWPDFLEGRLLQMDWLSSEQACPFRRHFGVGHYKCKSKTQVRRFLLSCAAGRGYLALWVRHLLLKAFLRLSFQRYPCPGRRGPSTAFGVCKTMRRSIQYCPWEYFCEATNCLVCVKLFTSSDMVSLSLKASSVCEACHVAQGATSQDVEIPSWLTLTNPNRRQSGDDQRQN